MTTLDSWFHCAPFWYKISCIFVIVVLWGGGGVEFNLIHVVVAAFGCHSGLLVGASQRDIKFLTSIRVHYKVSPVVNTFLEFRWILKIQLVL